MEVLIVISIILILTSAVGFMAFKWVDRARVVTARDQVQTYALALDSYALDCRGYPTQEQGLAALWEKPVVEPVPEGWNGPYVDKKVGSDPWGRAYAYTIPGPNGLPFGIKSLGADGAEGGDGNAKDITSWAD